VTAAVTLTGGCLCGAVRFSYAGALGGELGKVTVCHCGQCRRAQGYAVAVAPAVASGLTMIRGAGEVREFESSPGKFRAFCGGCGAPLWSRLAAQPAALRLRLGALDDPPAWLKVEAHIFTEGGPAWAQPDGAPRYPGREPGRVA
jgi:hypothetical protein